ncbi:hypothetical protein RBH26_20780 [Natronolimnohabitans sp. A-GB9]|uniref:hypothetical protein n=1 Tax=Natronolimnohabitans sp. A-GB9 TaxID=3069757 RepID=UPI0027B82DC9|nr:hypothetical protein [Natronolimnohabitans sp. A-GB9]MDQ2052880.1 hypothetical protein [Natronolimnohabitans sp. A-GB9]
MGVPPHVTMIALCGTILVASAVIAGILSETALWIAIIIATIAVIVDLSSTVRTILADNSK